MTKKVGPKIRGKEKRKQYGVKLEPQRAADICHCYGNGSLTRGIDAMFELLDNLPKRTKRRLERGLYSLSIQIERPEDY